MEMTNLPVVTGPSSSADLSSASGVTLGSITMPNISAIPATQWELNKTNGNCMLYALHEANELQRGGDEDDKICHLRQGMGILAAEEFVDACDGNKERAQAIFNAIRNSVPKHTDETMTTVEGERVKKPDLCYPATAQNLLNIYKNEIQEELRSAGITDEVSDNILKKAIDLLTIVTDQAYLDPQTIPPLAAKVLGKPILVAETSGNTINIYTLYTTNGNSFAFGCDPQGHLVDLESVTEENSIKRHKEELQNALIIVNRPGHYIGLSQTVTNDIYRLKSQSDENKIPDGRNDTCNSIINIAKRVNMRGRTTEAHALLEQAKNVYRDNYPANADIIIRKAEYAQEAAFKNAIGTEDSRIWQGCIAFVNVLARAAADTNTIREHILKNVPNTAEVTAASEPEQKKSAPKNRPKIPVVPAAAPTSATGGAPAAPVPDTAPAPGTPPGEPVAPAITATVAPLDASKVPEAINDIQDTLGLWLDDIHEDLLEMLPEHIAFDELQNGRGLGTFRGAYLENLQVFRIAVHGEENQLEIKNQRGFLYFNLFTNENRSVYARRGLEGRKNFMIDNGGPQQFDFSMISSQENGLFYVSCEPNQIENGFYDKKSIHAENFFKAIKAEKIEVVVDLRRTGEDEDYLNAAYGGDKLGVPAEVNDDHDVRSCEYDGHTFTQVKFPNIENNKFPGQDTFTTKGNRNMPQDMIDMCQKLDKYCIKPNGTRKKIVMHSSGGLGRAPSMTTAYSLWSAAKMAREKGIEVTCDWKNQAQLQVDGKLNLACVLRDTIINGTYARSTFIQSAEQFKSLANMAEVLGNAETTVLDTWVNPHRPAA